MTQGLLHGRAVTALLFLSGALAALVSLLVVAPPMLGMQALVVTSGSMEPAVSTGDAVIMSAVDAGTIRAGDLVVLRPLTSPGLKTHRVTDVMFVQGVPHVRTKGDANADHDPDLTPVDSVLGRVRIVAPRGGYLLQFANSPAGGLAIFALPLLILAAREFAAPRQPAAPLPRGARV